MSFFRPPTIYKQGNPPDQSSTSLAGDQVFPIPWVDDLWVDIQNHLVKRCTSQNPYTWVSIEGGGGGGAPTFDQIMSGTNISAFMVVGTGATLGHSGTGVVDATEINGIPITGTLTHAGQIPISQPGNTSAVWADPLVQGTQANGTAASTINPVLVSGVGPDTNQHQLSTDNSGNLNTVVSGTVAVSNFPATQPVSGTVTVTQATGTNLHVVNDASSAVIGHVIADTGSTTAVTGNVTVVQGTGTNLHAVLDAGSAVIGHVINDASSAVIGHVITDTGSTTAVTGTVAVSGTVTANAGTNLNTSLLALEAGGNLAAIKADVDKLPSQGQALAAASMPVVLTAAQITTLTPPSTVTVTQGTGTNLHAVLDAGAAVIGHMIADTGSTTAVTGNVTVVQGTGTNLHAVLDAGAAVIGHVINDASAAVIGHVIADTGSTTAVTGNVTVVQPTGTNLHTVLDAGAAVIGHVIADTGSTTAVTGTVTAAGNLTNNNAAPDATNIGTLPALGNANSPTWTEGDQVLESVDLHGSQRIMGGNVPEVTGSWTSATGSNTAITLTNIIGYAGIAVSWSATATITAGTITFEVSDTTAGTNWYPIDATNIKTRAALNTGNGTQPLSATNQGFQVDVTGWASFRVRLSTVITGTGTVSIGAMATQQAPSQGSASIQSATSSFAIGDNTSNVVPLPDPGFNNAPLFVAQSVYGGAFSGTTDAVRKGWSKQRTPTVFRAAIATASGNTAVWTPGASNKFRLLKFQVTVVGNAAFATTAGTVTITFQDSSTDMNVKYVIFVPLAAAATTNGVQFNSGLIDMGYFGVLSAAAGNVLNVNLALGGTGALGGGVVVNVQGTEE